MERFGYETTMHESYYDLVLDDGITKETELRSVIIGKVEEFKKKYDVVFVFINMKGYAQANMCVWSGPSVILRRFRGYVKNFLPYLFL